MYTCIVYMNWDNFVKMENRIDKLLYDWTVLCLKDEPSLKYIYPYFHLDFDGIPTFSQRIFLFARKDKIPALQDVGKCITYCALSTRRIADIFWWHYR